MTEKENIVYGAEPLGARVIAVKPLDDYYLLLDFNNGEQRLYDVKPLLEFKVFLPLKNKGLFEAVQIAYGTVVWPGGIDLCPDTIYQKSVQI